MKKPLLLLLCAALALCLVSCGSTANNANNSNTANDSIPGNSADPAGPPENSADPAIPPKNSADPAVPQDSATDMIYVYIDSEYLEILPEDNSSAAAFIELLKKGDVSVRMSDYGGFEKVGDLGTSLPRNDKQITTEPGDVILYLGHEITIYYASNSWSFTRLGRVQNADTAQIKSFLKAGGEDVTAVFTLNKR